MFQADAPQKNPIFSYYPALGPGPKAILSIPHSGEDIPEVFLPFLTTDLRALKEDVDYKVNELVDIPTLQSAGIGVLVAHVHRVCVDLNRAEENCIMFWKENTRGVPLVIKNPSPTETQAFIQRYHRPYFEVLSSFILDLEKRLATKVPVVDLHSMPSAPTAYHMKQNPNQKQTRSDFCVSDQKGKTCSPEFIQKFVEALKTNGSSVAVNDPYIGGYVTTFVDKFQTNNIQIEINRSIYMNEDSKQLNDEKVKKLRPHLTKSIITGLITE